MDSEQHLQIGEFAELVGLSIPQLRRYDRLRLLEPVARSAGSGYRYYSHGQTGAARVIALLRSMDMPIAEIRRVVTGIGEDERRDIFRNHRARLEARLDEVRQLLQAVDAINEEDEMTTDTDSETQLSSWLHVMPRIPVTDLDRSIRYYQEALDFRLDWQLGERGVAALASGEIETLLLTQWTGEEPPPVQSAYVYVEDPDSLCTEYRQAGAEIVADIGTRPYGMREFTVRDPDGHTFTLACGTEELRAAADQYGIPSAEISVAPSWLERRSPGR